MIAWRTGDESHSLQLEYIGPTPTSRPMRLSLESFWVQLHHAPKRESMPSQMDQATQRHPRVRCRSWTRSLVVARPGAKPGGNGLDDLHHCSKWVVEFTLWIPVSILSAASRYTMIGHLVHGLVRCNCDIPTLFIYFHKLRHAPKSRSLDIIRLKLKVARYLKANHATDIKPFFSEYWHRNKPSIRNASVWQEIGELHYCR